jgi:tripeptide aminopeptidase
MEKTSDRFIRYIKVDTQSDHDSESHPSTAKQFNLAKMLVKELQGLGLKDAAVDENCYVMATLPAKPFPQLDGWLTWIPARTHPVRM